MKKKRLLPSQSGLSYVNSMGVDLSNRAILWASISSSECMRCLLANGLISRIAFDLACATELFVILISKKKKKKQTRNAA
jgi:hypothetical protein